MILLIFRSHFKFILRDSVTILKFLKEKLFHLELFIHTYWLRLWSFYLLSPQYFIKSLCHCSSNEHPKVTIFVKCMIILMLWSKQFLSTKVFIYKHLFHTYQYNLFLQGLYYPFRIRYISLLFQDCLHHEHLLLPKFLNIQILHFFGFADLSF